MKNIYKIKKTTLTLLTLIYIILTLIEFVKYLCFDSNIFGLNYMVINLIIIFLLVPVCINYTKYYSAQRISKLIIIDILMLINCYLLNLASLPYIDGSREFIESIFVIKNILKGIIFVIITLFTLFEFKLQKLIQQTKKKAKMINKG
jgi:hypothetical protein